MDYNALLSRSPPPGLAAGLGVLPALHLQAKAASLDSLDRHLLALQVLLLILHLKLVLCKQQRFWLLHLHDEHE